MGTTREHAGLHKGLPGPEPERRDTVRRRIILATTITTIVLITVLCWISRFFLLQHFSDLEAARAADSLERAQFAIQEQVLQLDKIVLDNAIFDETYAFVVNPSQDYLRVNFGVGPMSTLARENYQALVLLNAQAKVIASRGYDPATRRNVPISADLAAHFRQNDKLFSLPMKGGAITGILLLKNGPLLVSARPILTSEGRGPIRGVLLMGTYIKPQDLEQLERKTRLSISLMRADDVRAAPDFLTAREYLASHTSHFVQALDEDTVAGYALFKDIYGKAAVVLKVRMSRALYHQAQLTVIYLAIALAVAGLVFGLVMEWLLDRILVSRLRNLDLHVQKIAENADSRARLIPEGNDEVGRLGNAVNSMLDSFEKVQTERLQAETRYRLFMDNSPLLAAILDEQGCYVYVNKPFETLLGLPLAEIRGRRSSNFFGTHPSAELAMQREESELHAALPREEVRHMPDGTEHTWLTVRFRLPSDGIRSLTGTLSLDITDRKKAERELIEAKEAAEIAAVTKSRFLANMSHEIRTPMNAILGLADLTLVTAIAGEQKENVSLIKSSAESLLAIINDILDFSKIEAGKLELAQVEFNVSELIAHCVALMRILAGQKGYAVNCDLAPDLPAYVIGDSARLRQVLINLLGNSIKFTERGEVRLDVTVLERQSENSILQFVVSDTGIGIPSDKHESIFDAFSQADNSAKRQFGGTGLGLTICNRLVQLMGGRIWLESRVGEGSRFFFTAKLQTVAERKPLTTDVKDRRLGMLDTANRFRKILVAEDNKVNQLIISRMLKSWDYTVTMAAHGGEALDCLRKESFDLLITDIQMPVMDGYELVASIRGTDMLNGRRLPILGLSAHAMPEERQRCLEAGMDAYLTKPIQVEQLRQELLTLAAECTSNARPVLA